MNWTFKKRKIDFYQSVAIDLISEKDVRNFIKNEIASDSQAKFFRRFHEENDDNDNFSLFASDLQLLHLDNTIGPSIYWWIFQSTQAFLSANDDIFDKKHSFYGPVIHTFKLISSKEEAYYNKMLNHIYNIKFRKERECS